MHPISKPVYSMIGVISALCLAGAVQAQLAGNEDYAQQARESLRKQHVQKRSSGLAFDAQSIAFSVGDKQYLSPTGWQFKRYTVPGSWGLDGFQGTTVPVTVINVEGEVTCSTLQDKVDKWGKVDDVWDESFLSSVLLTTDSSYHVASDVGGCLSGWGGSLLIKSGNATSDVNDIGIAAVQSAVIPQGPYLARIDGNVTLTQVYRMYRDEAQAFTTAVLATEGDTFVDHAVPVLGLNTITVPVPSRLYYLDLPDPRPLEGRRIAVKDLFDIAGLKTGGGNRAYFNLYPAKDVTAVAIQRLVGQGAIIVARAKTSQFANGEAATADWVDQMCPFNPRGDGYQQPSSSSSGPGASIAAYEWIDATIGSDTGGSIVDPASVQGVYGLRPSWGAVSLEGALPLASPLDTAGFFTRDAAAGAQFAKGWYGDKFGNYTQLPGTLILPNSSWTFEDGYAGAEQFNAFKDGLTSLFNSSIEYKSFDDSWALSSQYATANGQNLTVYLNTTYANIISYYQWNNLGQPFFEDFAGENDGRTPFTDPAPKVRWTYGRDNITQAVYEDSIARKNLFKEFVEQDVLRPDNTTCSSAVYVMPWALGNTDYRNIYKTPAVVPIGWEGNAYPAQFGGLPQLIVPVGQVSYESTITNHTEYLPLAAAMFAAHGCDYVLWDLAAKLQDQGVLSSVAAGTLAFPDRT